MLEHLIGLQLKKEAITIDGIQYEVREMTAEQASKYEASLLDFTRSGAPRTKLENVKQKLIIETLYYQGEKVFTMQDMEIVNNLPSSIISHIFNIATKLNKLDDQSTLKN